MCLLWETCKTINIIFNGNPQGNIVKLDNEYNHCFLIPAIAQNVKPYALDHWTEGEDQRQNVTHRTTKVELSALLNFSVFCHTYFL